MPASKQNWNWITGSALCSLSHCGVARHAWNWGLWPTKNILEYNKSHPDEKLNFPTAIDKHKLLVTLVKSENPWYYECSKSTPQQALMALRQAGKRCFNKTAGVPRFKKKGQRDSFTLEGTVKILGNNKIQVPVIGILKTYERLPQVLTCVLYNIPSSFQVVYQFQIWRRTARVMPNKYCGSWPRH